MSKLYRINNHIHIGAHISKNGMGFGASAIKNDKFIFYHLYTSEKVSINLLIKEVDKWLDKFMFKIYDNCLERNKIKKSIELKLTSNEIVNTNPLKIEYNFIFYFYGSEIIKSRIANLQKSGEYERLYLSKMPDKYKLIAGNLCFEYRDSIGNINDNLICIKSAIEEESLLVAAGIDLEAIEKSINDFDEEDEEDILINTLSASLGELTYQKMTLVQPIWHLHREQECPLSINIKRIN